MDLRKYWADISVWKSYFQCRMLMSSCKGLTGTSCFGGRTQSIILINYIFLPFIFMSLRCFHDIALRKHLISWLGISNFIWVYLHGELLSLLDFIIKSKTNESEITIWCFFLPFDFFFYVSEISKCGEEYIAWNTLQWDWISPKIK